MSAEEYELINEFVTRHFGITFPIHKKMILEARLRPRLKALRLHSYMDYYLRLQFDPKAELSLLATQLTNNESYFFRETKQFESLFGSVFDELKASSAGSGPLRFLCAGCSSGEEPYTLKIYATNYCNRMLSEMPMISAVDVDPQRLSMAQAAEYGPRSMRALDEDQMDRYFTRVSPERFVLNPEYREGIEFSLANILELRTFRKPTRYDVIFCRNVLIYFSDDAFHNTITNFARCLRPGGLLFLGHSETIIGRSSDFEPVRLEQCLAYRRIDRG